MKIQYKLTFALLLASLIPLTMIGWYGIATFSNTLRHDITKSQSIEVEGLARDHMGVFISTTLSDALILSRSAVLQELLQDVDLKKTESIRKAKADTAREFESIALARGNYSKICYIDSTGKEMVKIERRESGYYISEGAQLQDTSQDEYFLKGIALSGGQTYISDLQLETQGGKIITPHQAGIRVVTPVFFMGSSHGVLVINVEGRSLLKMLKEHSSLQSQLIMVDDTGAYLIHPDERKLWGPQLGTGERLSRDEPALAALVAHQDKGTYEDNERLIAFSKVPINATEGPRWTLIEVIPKSVVYAPIRDVQRTIFLVILLALALSVGSGWFVARRIASPIEALSQAAEKLRAGDLSVSIPKTEDDEVGRLAASFSLLASDLQMLIGRVEDGALQLAEATQALSAASQQVETGAEQVSLSVQRIAEGARSQAREIEVTSRGIASQARAITATAQQSAEAAEQVQQARQAALVGVKGIHTVTNHLHDLEKANREVEHLVALLNEHSEEMEQVIATINNFADQTNMLALNASIEAARAGTQGRGFSVVANEVRRLAHRSGRSATDVAELITQTQQRISDVLAQVAAESQAISAGAQAMDILHETLQTIVDSMNRAADVADRISKITAEQQATSETMVQAMNAIASVSEGNVVSTEDASASLQEQTAATEELATSARQLAHLASELREAVARLTGQETK